MMQHCNKETPLADNHQEINILKLMAQAKKMDFSGIGQNMAIDTFGKKSHLSLVLTWMTLLSEIINTLSRKSSHFKIGPTQLRGNAKNSNHISKNFVDDSNK